MKKSFSVFLIFANIVLCGCASQTAKMAHKIGNDKENRYEEKNSTNCVSKLLSTENDDLIFNTRIIATPLIGFLGILAAPALLAANMSLDVNDRLTASKLSEDCGGKPIDSTKIAGDVALNGTIGLVLQGSNLSIYPGGEEVPISAAAEASSN